MAAFNEPSDMEMFIEDSGEDEPIAAPRPKSYFVKSVFGAVVLGGLAFCGSQVFSSSAGDKPSVFFGQTIELADDVDPNVALVQKMFGAWGTGKFHGDACEEAAKEFFTEDAVMDARAPAANTDMYKKYHGIKGLCEWCKNLEAFNFTTFKIEQMYPYPKDKVLAQVTYLPTLSGPKGEKGDEKVLDGQIWTLKDGKISDVVFLFSGIAEADALFGDKKTDLEPTDDVKDLEEMLKLWGDGKFNGDECPEAAAKIAGDDFTATDPNFEEGWKGPDGYCKWAKVWGPIAAKCKDFKPVTIFSNSPDNVIMEVQYHWEGEDATTKDIHYWSFKDGKLLSHLCVAGKPEIWK